MVLVHKGLGRLVADRLTIRLTFVLYSLMLIMVQLHWLMGFLAYTLSMMTTNQGWSLVKLWLVI